MRGDGYLVHTYVVLGKGLYRSYRLLRVFSN
jgi:hypothetical protein